MGSEHRVMRDVVVVLAGGRKEHAQWARVTGCGCGNWAMTQEEERVIHCK